VAHAVYTGTAADLRDIEDILDVVSLTEPD
jgi:hypothetical protein